MPIQKYKADSLSECLNENTVAVPDNAGMAVEVCGLKIAFSDEKIALDNLSIKLQPGSFTAIVGPSGAGKSTFVRSLNRFVEPTDGAIYLNGQDASKIRKKILRRSVAMIFQQFNLVPQFTALINILIGRLGYLSGWRALLPTYRIYEYEIAMLALRRVGLLDKALTPCHMLSGGQQQRVAIARAITQEAKLLIADEPVASLDPSNAKNIMDLLRMINKEDGVTVIANLHQVEFAKEYADRVLGIKSGKIVFDGTPDMLDDFQYAKIYN